MATATRMMGTREWRSAWWKGHSTWLVKHLQQAGLSNENKKRTTSFNHKFGVAIPEREEWENGPPVAENSCLIFTDGSKMDTGVGAGVFSWHLNLSSWTRMESHATVFQAEIQAIKMAAELVKGSSGERWQSVWTAERRRLVEDCGREHGDNCLGA